MALTRNPPRLPSENSRQFAFRILYENIICLALEPGEQLSEQELSEALNISRTPIREAILALQNLRLIEVLPQRSSCVSRINMDYVEEGVFLRRAVETSILQEARLRVTESDLSAMRENLSIQRLRLSEERWSEYVKADDDFHGLLYEAACKPRIWSSVTSITTHLTRLRRMQYRADTETFFTGYKEHEFFYEILAERREMDLSEEVNLHLTVGYKRVLPYLQETYPHYFV